MRLDPGTWLIIGLATLLMWTQGNLLHLIGGTLLAVSVAWLTAKQLEKTTKAIYQDMERQLLSQVSAIRDKEARRVVREKADAELDGMEERYLRDIQGLRTLTIILGLAVWAWPLLGLVALCGMSVGWLKHVRAHAASWKEAAAKILEVHGYTPENPPQPDTGPAVGDVN